MPTGGSEAEQVVDVRVDFPETGRVMVVKVWLVPESEAHPEGVKYSMHYGTTTGDTILRYDNAHPETKGHERHVGGETEPVEFPGWQELLGRFRREVTTHEREHRTD